MRRFAAGCAVVCALVIALVGVKICQRQTQEYKPISFDRNKWPRTVSEWNRVRTDLSNPRLAMAEDIVATFPGRLNKSSLVKVLGTPSFDFPYSDKLHREFFEPFYDSWHLDKERKVSKPDQYSKLAYQVLFIENTLQSNEAIYLVFLLDKDGMIVNVAYSNQ